MEVEPEKDVFRLEALEHQAQARIEGDIVRLKPLRTGWTALLSIAVAAAALIFVLLGRVDHYARGTGVVRVEGELTAIAEQTGVVASVDVQPGDHVAAGRQLVALHGFKVPGARAPVDAVVAEVHVRAGQHVMRGQTLAMLIGPNTRLSLEAVFAGSYRSRFPPGSPIRFGLSGPGNVALDTEVDSIAGDVEPIRVLGILGSERADAISVLGPPVLITARIESPTFDRGGRRFPYREGMLLQCFAVVGSETILSGLFAGTGAP